MRYVGAPQIQNKKPGRNLKLPLGSTAPVQILFPVGIKIMDIIFKQLSNDEKISTSLLVGVFLANICGKTLTYWAGTKTSKRDTKRRTP